MIVNHRPSKSLHSAEKINPFGAVCSTPFRSIYASIQAGAVACVLSLAALPIAKGQDAAPKKIVDIPDSLFQVQDQDGFFWQLTGNGALTSGETQYLQSGMNLLVDNVVFAPGEALVRAPGEGVSKIDAVFTENRKELVISRDVWIDTKRSGVRFFDSIKNTGANPVDVVVVLRTTYPFGWQSLHDTGGDLLSSDPVLRLDENDNGLTVHFSPAEGRHDTLFLTGTDADGVEPVLQASTNSRELTFQYNLSIKAGETASLYHWMMQRNLQSPASAAEVLPQFSQRNQLINPGVSSRQAVSVVNFPRSAFPDETAAPSRLRELLALNELMDQIGWHRRRTDAHWLGQTNQISGELSRTGSLTITGNEFGERVVPLAQIAAIRGSSGSGMKPFLYLRNGEVLTGDLAGAGFDWKVGESTKSLSIDEIHLLLLGTEVSDGAPPAKATHFVKFSSGVILAVDGSSSEALDYTASWGEGQISLSELVELGYVSSPNPGFVIRTDAGSFFNAFLPMESGSLKGLDGKTIEFPMVMLDAIWKVGATSLEVSDRFGQWIDFAEIPKSMAPAGGFLLSGNTVLAGDFEDDVIAFNDGRAGLSIATDNIVSLTRLAREAGSDPLRFEVILKSGDRISGSPVSPLFGISLDGKAIEVPVAYLQSYRAAPGEAKAK